MKELSVGNKIIVSKGSEKENTIIVEGLTGTVINKQNTIITVKFIVNNDSLLVRIIQDGRGGTIYTKYSRADRAKEIIAEKAYKLNEFNKQQALLDNEIAKLSFDTDEAYNDSIFATKVKAIVAE